MRVAIRTDASESIGSGHVMRCLTLAEGLRAGGSEVLFICRDLPSNLNAIITAKGFDLCSLPAPPGNQQQGLDWNPHAGWLGVPWQQDAEETRDCLLKTFDGCDWLVSDHYALDKNWENILRSVAVRIMVIDDLADRRHDCDLLLDQNLYKDQDKRYTGLVPEHCTTLLGPGYALLRSEFLEARKRLSRRNGKVDNILVFFGGVDATNETEKTIEAIAQLKRNDLFVDVVVGAGNPHRAKIRNLCERRENVRFHCQVSHMAEMMARADLSIGAGGTVTWERFCLGLPSLVIAVAENQNIIAEDCARDGCQIYLGTTSSVDEEVLSAAIRTSLQSPSLLVSIATRAMKKVDGKGLFRVMQWLCPLEIKLRKAGPEDCRNIYEWRNAEETRRHIFDKETIPFEVHQRWFENSLKNDARIILIGEHAGKPLGVLRFDLAGDQALISVYLVPGHQPPGAGTQLIKAGSNWLAGEHPEIRKINAEILGDNMASIKAFEKAGYKLNHLTYCKD